MVGSNGDLISRSALKRYIQENGMVYANKLDDFPAVDAVSRAVFEQIKWERDTAFQQLKDHGIPFGGTAPDVVKVLLCAFCAKFDTSGYENSNEEDFLLHVGHCKHWGKSTQGCGFCDQRERRQDDG